VNKQATDMSETTATTKTPCPNPRCDRLVLADQKVCAACGHNLEACPKCGKLISKTIGRCGWCGHRLADEQAAPAMPGDAYTANKEATQPAGTPPSPFAEAQIIVRFEVSRSSVRRIMAEAYGQAALADANMNTATRILEATLGTLLTEPDAFEIWRRLDEAVGSADAKTLRPALITLRAWFREQLLDQQRERLSKSFERDPETGWREWLQTYAEGLARWRHLLCQNLVDAPFLFPEGFHKPYDFKRATQLVMHERWIEAHKFFIFLAEQEELHAHARARLLITAGQIHLYYFSPLDRALTFFQRAEELAPNHSRVLAAMGDYYREQNDFVKARTYLEHAMEVAPNDVEAYLYMGDMAEKQDNLEEARSWYQEAINKAIGDSDGYLSLLLLYGRPEFIEHYEAHIAPLAERATAVDETGEYKTYLYVGDAYAASQRYETAHQWYDKAIELEPDRLGGHISKGFACLGEGESRYDAAQMAFEAAIQVAPESYNGYWGMGQLAERRDQWAEAAEWYAQAMRRQSEFYSSLQSKIGEMHWKLGNLEKAKDMLLDALKHDHTNDARALDLADDYYKTQGKPEEALRLFSQIREIKGDGFEASYQNRVGNVYYYEEEYEKAAQHYLNAIRSDDKEEVYFSNLSDAYQRLERWTDAREYLKKAYDLHGDRQKYESQLARVYIEQAQALEKSLPTSADGLNRLDEAIAGVRADLEQAQGKGLFSDQLARLEQMRAFVMRYGAHALSFDTIDAPIRVRVASDMVRAILNADLTELSKDFLSLIDAMRERLRERCGMRVPGLRFSELVGPGIPSDSYQIEVMDERIADGRLEAYERLNTHELLLRHIERILSGHLDKLCGPQETAALLEQCSTSDCQQIKDDPHKLNLLTRRLKDILRHGESVAGLAPIAMELNEQATSSSGARDKSRHERPEPELTPDITALTLYLGESSPSPPDRAALSQEFRDMQSQLFDELGVIAPQIAIADGQLIIHIGFQLQINDEQLPVQFGSAPVQFVIDELRRRADQLLTPDLVEYYLTKLQTDFPALVNVTRHYFSAEELTWQLRRRLIFRSSIKNLPRVLDELISTAGDVS